jgi:predicted transcriptional regulator of viral defense system
MVSARTVSPEAAAVLEHVAAAKRSTVSLPADRQWLASITPHYARLLDRMVARKSLYRVLRGRYVVAPRGTEWVEQAAPVELCVDLVLREAGEYYLGFLTALIAHRLTDLHASTVFVAVGQDSRTDLTSVKVCGHELRLVRLASSRWPRGEGERERVRIQPGLKEFVWRASLERTLVDCLLHPELCAGIETAVSSWARASNERDVDWEAVWTIAKRSGAAAAPRVAYLLIATGHADTLAGELPLARGETLLDRTNGYRMDRSQMSRDPQTGLLINVPTERLRGWIKGGKLG